MDAFVIVKKSPSFLDRGKTVISNEHSSSNTLIQRTNRISKPRFTPYSKATRLERIQRALEGLPDDEGGLLSASISSPVFLKPSLLDVPSSSANTSAVSAGSLSPVTRESSPPATNTSNGDDSNRVGCSSSHPIQRKDILNMKHISNPIVHSAAPRRSRKSQTHHKNARVSIHPT